MIYNMNEYKDEDEYWDEYEDVNIFIPIIVLIPNFKNWIILILYTCTESMKNFSSKSKWVQTMSFTVPSRSRGLTKVKVNVKVKVNIWWDPSRGPKEESQQVDHLRRCQDKASPGWGVARLRRRQVEASPG